MFDMELPARTTDELLTLLLERQLRHESRNRGGWFGFIAAGVACAALPAAGVFGYRWWTRRQALCAIAAVDATGIPAAIAAGAEYNPDSRDCVEGEKHDFIVVEDDCEDADLDEDASGGSNGEHSSTPARRSKRVGAARRVAKRKKVVHTPYEHGIVSGAFLGDVITQARLAYNARVPDSYTQNLARSLMVRLMKDAGMRNAHIDQNIANMVNAVFLQTRDQVVAAENQRVLMRAGVWGGQLRP
jgi:hypothetical protein